jgi:hypothetical protein
VPLFILATAQPSLIASNKVGLVLGRSRYHCFIGKTTWSGSASDDLLKSAHTLLKTITLFRT